MRDRAGGTGGSGSEAGDSPAGTGDDADDRPVVLAVDDEERVVQAFDLWLGDDYRVLTATSGSEGLDRLTDAVDVVLLDRHMPGLSGGEVLERIRESEHDCQVAMVTAVDPDFDIVEMPFDDYVPKPVDESTLREVVDRLLTVGRYDERMSELYAVSQTVATLEAEKTQAQLREDDRYTDLLDERDRLQAELDAMMESMGETEFERIFDADAGTD